MTTLFSALDWRAMSREALDLGLNNGVAVSGSTDMVAGWEQRFPQTLDNYVLILKPSDVSTAQAQRVVDGVAKQFGGIKAQNKAQFKASQVAQFNQILGLVYVLLLFAVIIALVGIVNTLALSIYERTERSAVTDGLTGLYNHAFFLQALRQEVLRSKRHGLRAALLLLDLDNFKQVNDERGHVGPRRCVQWSGAGHSVAMDRAAGHDQRQSEPHRLVTERIHPHRRRQRCDRCVEDQWHQHPGRLDRLQLHDRRDWR